MITCDRGDVTNAVAVANGLQAPVERRAFAQETIHAVIQVRVAGGLGAALIVSGFVASPALAADAEHPTVIELFQSQGCSSCPPANASLIQFSQRSDVLALNFAVTYWDRLGWKDTFATPQYTQRQYDYSTAMHGSGVYTPQIVVNGRAEGVGDEVSEMEALARKTDRGASGPEVKIEGGEVVVGAGTAPAHGADVWLALYDPRVVDVAGRTRRERGADARAQEHSASHGAAGPLDRRGRAAAAAVERRIGASGARAERRNRADPSRGEGVIPSPALAGEGGAKRRMRGVRAARTRPTLTPALSRKSGRGGLERSAFPLSSFYPTGGVVKYQTCPSRSRAP